MRVFSLVVITTSLLAVVAASADIDKSVYGGQTPPGSEPKGFQIGVSDSTATRHGAMYFSSNENTVLWSIITMPGMKGTILLTTHETGAAKTTIASFASGLECRGAALSPDGNTIYFSSDIPLPSDSTKKTSGVYGVRRTSSGWGTPVPIEATIDTLITKGQVSVARSGNIYFGGRVLAERTPAIFVCKYTDGKYSRPEKLAGAIAALPLAADPWVDPDERFMLVACPPPDGPPMLTDIGVSIRQNDGSWGLPVRIGGGVNTATGFERFPSLSPDGKFLFFIRCMGQRFVGGDARYFWVSADVLDTVLGGR